MALYQSVTLDELVKQDFGEILQSIANDQLFLTVILPGGEEIIISPKQPLKPLRILQGSMPDGWKEAIYDDAK